MSGKIRVFLAEDNLRMTEIIKSFFELTEQMEICGTADNGEDAVQQILLLLPDVVVLDLIMPKLDGIGVLEALRREPPATPPLIIVTSAVGEERITQQALSLGATYYIIKPYSLHDLCNRISLMVEGPRVEAERAPERNQENAISKLVRDLGVSTSILGYRYIVRGVELILEKGSYPISKQVYATLAEENDTTADCVESAIRKTISRIFAEENKALHTLFPKEKKPSNAQFLTVLAETIK